MHLKNKEWQQPCRSWQFEMNIFGEWGSSLKVTNLATSDITSTQKEGTLEFKKKITLENIGEAPILFSPVQEAASKASAPLTYQAFPLSQKCYKGCVRWEKARTSVV